jgi:hypothetical protein
MKNTIGLAFALSYCFSIHFLSPVSGETQAKTNESPDKTRAVISVRPVAAMDLNTYNRNRAELNVRYKDNSVARCFEQADIDPEKFVKAVAEPKVVEDSPAYAGSFQQALIKAKVSDWKGVQKELVFAFSLEHDLPDMIILMALAEKKTGEYAKSLEELAYLYKLREERRYGYMRSADSKNDNYRDDIYWALKSSGQLDKLRGLRAQNYEGLYSQFGTALNSF